MTEWIDPLSDQTLIQRNSTGLPIKLTEADPDSSGPLASAITVLGYSSLGNLRYQKNPDNSTKTWTYDSTFNLPLTATDELSRVTEYTYDGDGNVTVVTDPGNFDTTFTYDGLGLVTSMTTPDPDGGGGLTAAETTYDYDEFGRLETITYADATTRVYGYDSADNVTSDEDELGHAATYEYDQLGRLTSATDHEDAKTTYSYDALGLVVKVSNALDKETDYEYDDRNFLVSLLQPDPDGSGALSRPESVYGYDAVGNQTSIGQGAYFSTPLTHEYDAANRLVITTQTVDLVTFTTTYMLNNLGRVINVNDPLDHNTSYNYSNRGWVTKITGQDPDAGGRGVGPVTEFGYDAAGQQVSVTDPRGFVTTTTYDSRGLATTTSQPDPDASGPQWAPTTYYNYDNLGRLKAIDDPLCRITVYAYTDRDQIESITLPDPDGAGGASAPVWSFGYDDAGRRTSVTDPLSRVTSYTFDDVGRTLTQTDPDPDGMGGTFTLTFGANTTSGIAYNASAATVQSALEALGSVGSGNVSVTKLQSTGSAQEWRLTIQASLGGTNVSQTTINSSGVSGFGLSNIQATDTQGATNDEVQAVTLSDATGGTFRLAFLGEITPPLDFDASSSEVDTALEDLNAVDEVTVSGDPGGPWTVTFIGDHSDTARLKSPRFCRPPRYGKVAVAFP